MRHSLLSNTPNITREDGTLVARTSISGWLLTLTLLYRTVRFDPRRKRLTRDRTLFWFFRKKTTIRFREIQSITYSYDNWNLSSHFSAGDTRDCLTVGLNLTDRRYVHLFRFLGEGTFVNNGIYPDWMYWADYTFDFAGTQGETSKAYAELLEKMLNVPVVRTS